MFRHVTLPLRFIIALLFSLSLLSCEKEKELATKITQVLPMQSQNMVFSYDDQGRVLKIVSGNQTQFDYQYFNDSTIVYFSFHVSGDVRMERTTKVYYTNQLVTKIIIRYRLFEDVSFDTLKLNYDASNRLVAFNDISLVVVDKNNNITSAELNGITYTFKFDNKPNPFKGIPGFGYIGYSWTSEFITPFEVNSLLGGNNITEYLYSGQPTYQYRFNIGYKSGMPVSYVLERWEGTTMLSVRGYIQDIQYSIQ